MKKQNLVLIGFKGCGKTTYGREMARLARLPFADLDEQVEFILGESITDFVAKHGWQVFREVEQKVVYDFSRHFSGIVATGGGTIENSKNLQTLKDFGGFLFLSPPFMQVRDYLLSDQSQSQRPRINPDIPLTMEIDQLWSQRRGIYSASADKEVNPDLLGNAKLEARKILTQLPISLVPDRPPKRKVVVMASGNGTTLQGLIDAQKIGRIPNVEITALITDNPDAGAIGVAKDAKIPNIEILKPQKGETKEEYERELLNIIRGEEPDYILLLGFMRILSPLYCENVGQKSINVHPSLLPDYANMKDREIHEAVLQNADRYTGCTLHRVTAVVDGGEQILQRKVLVDETDTVETLRTKVQKQEVLGLCEVLERR